MWFLGRTTKYPGEVLRLEATAARLFAQTYGVSFCNGTSGVRAGLFASGVAPGSTVIMSTMSFQSTVMSALHCGYNIKFCDVKDNLALDFSSIVVDKEDKILVVSSLFGFPQEMREVMQFADKHKLFVLEDCSHAHGASYDSKPIGSFGDVAVFSLQGDKAVAGGEAGIAVTSDKRIYDRMRLFMHMGRDLGDVDPALYGNLNVFKRVGFGQKGRMHPFAAALASVDMRTLSKRNKRYRSNIGIVRRIVNRSKGLRVVEQVQDSDLGGFHYGIPIIVDTSHYSVDLLIENSGSIFLRYPYAHYESYPCFRDSSAFRDLIWTGNASPERLSEMQNIKRLRQSLVFLNFDVFRRLSYYSRDLEKAVDAL
jgi:dTDP-4-amino-4,6-dideoxygalactose transaminase